jgi:hypothetical protein
VGYDKVSRSGSLFTEKEEGMMPQLKIRKCETKAVIKCKMNVYRTIVPGDSVDDVP